MCIDKIKKPKKTKFTLQNKYYRYKKASNNFATHIMKG